MLELFDKPAGFADDDRRLVAAAAEFGAELLRQALAERQTHRLLFDAVEAALQASEHVARTLAYAPRVAAGGAAAAGGDGRGSSRGWPPTRTPWSTPTPTLRLAEAVRVLAVRHGPPAVEHCIAWSNDLRKLLDDITGTE